MILPARSYRRSCASHLLGRTLAPRQADGVVDSVRPAGPSLPQPDDRQRSLDHLGVRETGTIQSTRPDSVRVPADWVY